MTALFSSYSSALLSMLSRDNICAVGILLLAVAAVGPYDLRVISVESSI